MVKKLVLFLALLVAASAVAKPLYNLQATNYADTSDLSNSSVCLPADAYWVTNGRGFGVPRVTTQAAGANGVQSFAPVSSSGDWCFAYNTKTAYAYTNLQWAVGGGSATVNYWLVRVSQVASTVGDILPSYCYGAYFQSNNTYLMRFDAGGSTTNLAIASGVTYAPGDSYRLIADGSSLTLYHNGALLLSATDTTYTSGGIGQGSWTNNPNIFPPTSSYLIVDDGVPPPSLHLQLKHSLRLLLGLLAWPQSPLGAEPSMVNYGTWTRQQDQFGKQRDAYMDILAGRVTVTPDPTPATSRTPTPTATATATPTPVVSATRTPTQTPPTPTPGA